MKCKYQTKPVYEEVEILGKTVKAITGTIDRKTVGRALITAEAGFTCGHEVVDGDSTPIRSVWTMEEGETKELFVQLVGGVRSLASYKFFEGYTAKNPENPEVNELFTKEDDKVARLVETASRMCAAHPECDGQWEIVDASNARWFIRLYDPFVNANGMRE